MSIFISALYIFSLFTFVKKNLFLVYLINKKDHGNVASTLNLNLKNENVYIKLHKYILNYYTKSEQRLK